MYISKYIYAYKYVCKHVSSSKSMGTRPTEVQHISYCLLPCLSLVLLDSSYACLSVTNPLCHPAILCLVFFAFLFAPSDTPLIISASYLTVAHKRLGMVRRRQRLLEVSDCIENDNGSKTRLSKTKLGRKWQICSFSIKNEIRSVSSTYLFKYVCIYIRV